MALKLVKTGIKMRRSLHFFSPNYKLLVYRGLK